MMGWRIWLRNGSEYDHITGWRHVTGHKPGTRSRIKQRGIRRRDRRAWRLGLKGMAWQP